MCQRGRETVKQRLDLVALVRSAVSEQARSQLEHGAVKMTQVVQLAQFSLKVLDSDIQVVLELVRIAAANTSIA